MHFPVVVPNLGNISRPDQSMNHLTVEWSEVWPPVTSGIGEDQGEREWVNHFAGGKSWVFLAAGAMGQHNFPVRNF